MCLGVGVLHLGRCKPFRHLQCRAEGEVHGQSVLGTLRRLWQGCEQRDPGGAVADGFQIGRAVAGLLAGLLPVGNGLLVATSRGVVMRQQLGLRLDQLGKPCLQHLGNVLVILLPRAPEQRLIGRVLDEGMLEGVCRLHQLRQRPLEGRGIER